MNPNETKVSSTGKPIKVKSTGDKITTVKPNGTYINFDKLKTN
jgi:hypothetical protein